MKKKSYLILTPLLVTTIFLLYNCSGDSPALPSETGTAGSMARFAVKGNSLYAVNNNSMKIFDITQSENPELQSEMETAFTIETIFPFKNSLFIGTQEGMQIYNISDPSSPKFLSSYSHILSCDPVVADDDYAYVTIRNGSRCRIGNNELHIVNINDLNEPVEKAVYAMQKPFGLGIRDKILFVCDDGLKVYDVNKPDSIFLKGHFANIEAFDVIALESSFIVIGENALYQYKIVDNKLVTISKFNFSKI